MSTSLLPFNISILILKDTDIQGMRPVKVLDIFAGGSKDFHPDGLFSIETFGKPGEERRNRLYSYMDLKVKLFHPTLFKAIVNLKNLYGGILSGKEYAVWDPIISDFVKSSIAEGETGYSFFVKHFKNIKFQLTDSAQRDFSVKLVEKYKDNAMFSKLIVMPAGLRDYTIDDDGKPTEDEINRLYRKCLSPALTLDNINVSSNESYLDTTRYNLQLAVQEVYDYVISLIEGKRKLMLGRFASRKIMDSTRNVITSSIPEVTELHGSKSVSCNETTVGLYQFLRCIMPIAVNLIRQNFSNKIFTGPNTPATLVDPKTLKRVMVDIDPDLYDEWVTYEGIEKLCARFKEEALRHDILQYKGYYFGLVYKGPDNTFRFVQDVDELPEGRSPKDLHPITYAELLYMAVYKEAKKTYGFLTRYPVTGLGSIVPTGIYLRSTVKSEVRKELDYTWQVTEDVSAEFPIQGLSFFNSMAPPSSKIKRMGADFDGDTSSMTCVWTKDAVEEIENLLGSRDFYVNIDDKMTFSHSDDIINLMMASFTS